MLATTCHSLHPCLIVCYRVTALGTKVNFMSVFCLNRRASWSAVGTSWNVSLSVSEFQVSSHNVLTDAILCKRSCKIVVLTTYLDPHPIYVVASDGYGCKHSPCYLLCTFIKHRSYLALVSNGTLLTAFLGEAMFLMRLYAAYQQSRLSTLLLVHWL